MNWTAILAAAGIPEPPDRTEAVAATNARTAAKHQAAAEARQAKREKK